jgi:hypothetical protein
VPVKVGRSHVHGEDVVERLALQAGNAGFYLAGMHRPKLFKTVILEAHCREKLFQWAKPARSASIWKHGRYRNWVGVFQGLQVLFGYGLLTVANKFTHYIFV